MVSQLLSKVFGSRNDRLLKRMDKTVAKINALEPEISALDDSALRAKTDEFKARLAKGETLDDLLPEAFAVPASANMRWTRKRQIETGRNFGWCCIADGCGDTGENCIPWSGCCQHWGFFYVLVV